MIKRISRRITDQLLCNGEIDEDSYEVYEYGMEHLLTNVINTTTIIALGAVFRNLQEAIAFGIAFMLLRKYAGGYHASTPLKCYFLTIGVITAMLSVVKYVKLDIFICVLLLGLSDCIIFFLSPVEAKNKPLDDIEKITYRKKAILISAVESLCFVILQVIGLRDLSLGIVFAQAVTGSSMIFEEKIKKESK